MDRDDLVQTAWMYVVEAINQYDDSRGAKLSTFVFLKLLTKFSNIARKMKTYSKASLVSFDLLGGAADGFQEDESSFGVPDQLMDFIWEESNDLDLQLDVSRFVDGLTDKEKRICVRYFIEGQTQAELKKRRPNSSMAGIKQSIKQIHSKAVAELQYLEV
jgi:DNA-directed RNA polymerase specialized sigma subunit